MSELCSICKDVSRPTSHRCNVCNNPVHNILCATLLSDTECDTRICNACSTTMPKEKVGKRDSSHLAEPQEDTPRNTKKFQSTISIFLKRKTKDTEENKQEVKEFQTLKQSEVHDFYVDDTNIESKTSSFESSLASLSKASLLQ